MRLNEAAEHGWKMFNTRYGPFHYEVKRLVFHHHSNCPLPKHRAEEIIDFFIHYNGPKILLIRGIDGLLTHKVHLADLLGQLGPSISLAIYEPQVDRNWIIYVDVPTIICWGRMQDVVPNEATSYFMDKVEVTYHAKETISAGCLANHNQGRNRINEMGVRDFPGAILMPALTKTPSAPAETVIPDLSSAGRKRKFTDQEDGIILSARVTFTSFKDIGKMLRCSADSVYHHWQRHLQERPVQNGDDDPNPILAQSSTEAAPTSSPSSGSSGYRERQKSTEEEDDCILAEREGGMTSREIGRHLVRSNRLKQKATYQGQPLIQKWLNARGQLPFIKEENDFIIAKPNERMTWADIEASSTGSRSGQQQSAPRVTLDVPPVQPPQGRRP
ncbi:hypothetical protein N7474_009487 [Penicillium riverlandense]|uniref:uncharacterized protein n=1 Tax=Penicillium riverlandense TaxID=1903569 RepID=UPI00254909F9|nr:uncharacterized protein N7474_009487 [Penicillium riverlandense]KAJ5808218.1 hypothetical protein N7474_009487 [Penicillium riverlandense]